ncbi:hypothetical protein [Pseudomonas rhodesiae]|uniref:hypothetical protein n=1 Tax=Pseudomonas rhodesiae TaxID=76760 RepID=UPI001F26A8A4|nr:hypothetical protein [Pseudomonas rhodesiae]
MSPEWAALWDLVWRFISSESLPAWLQAVGSIVALYVAFRVSRSSIEHAGLLKQKTIFSIAEAAHEYANKVRVAIDLIDKDPGSNAYLYEVYHKDVTAGVVRALQGIPVHELASGQQVLAVLGLANQLVFLGAAADKLMFAPSLLPGVSKELESMGDDREMRREYLSGIKKTLKRNAIGHLDIIDMHYHVLKSSLVR